jgi:VanZ family protein
LITGEERTAAKSMFPPIEPDFPPERPRPRIIILPAPPRRGILRRYLPLWLLLLWMGVIFLASTGLGRPENSEKIIDPVLRWLGVVQVGQVHLVVRKMGHVVEYFILGLLLSYFCLSSPWQSLRRWWFAVALLGAFVYACTDEAHQLLVPERHGSFVDVMLDTASAAVALLLLAGARKLFRFLFVIPSSLAPRP